MPGSGGYQTLDDLFRRSLSRKSWALALVDPANKTRVTGQPPRRLTYMEADRAITALATQFIDAGLPPGSVIAVQLPNIVEFYLTLLAAARAGLVVAVLPLLWRQSDLATALTLVGARAIVGVTRIDIVDHAEIVLNAAAEVFSIRHVFSFGNNVPDGMIPLEIVTNADANSPQVALDARRAAVISFDTTADGLRVVPRTHINLIAGGLAIFLEAGIAQGAKIVSTIAPPSFAGLASSLVTWLLAGGTLILHHPFDIARLESQLRDEFCETLIAPAALALRMYDAGLFKNLPSLKEIVALWRTPERIASSTAWPQREISLTDIYLFGEVGLLAARRTANGLPPDLVEGPQGKRGSNPASPASGGDIVVTPQRTIALRGAMVPAAAFRPANHDSEPDARDAGSDYVDTGYGVQRSPSGTTLKLSAPPAGIVAVGGYRFRTRDLDGWSQRLGHGAGLTALPHQFSGHRLAGRADNSARVREVLGELGLNPLMIEAFRETNP